MWIHQPARHVSMLVDPRYTIEGFKEPHASHSSDWRCECKTNEGRDYVSHPRCQFPSTTLTGYPKYHMCMWEQTKKKRGDPNGQSYSGHEKPKTFLIFWRNCFFFLAYWTYGIPQGESVRSFGVLTSCSAAGGLGTERTYIYIYSVKLVIDDHEKDMTHLFPLPHVHSNQHKWNGT